MSEKLCGRLRAAFFLSPQTRFDTSKMLLHKNLRVKTHLVFAGKHPSLQVRHQQLPALNSYLELWNKASCPSTIIMLCCTFAMIYALGFHQQNAKLHFSTAKAQMAGAWNLGIFRSQTLISCVYWGFTVHGYINKSALRAPDNFYTGFSIYQRKF